MKELENFHQQVSQGMEGSFLDSIFVPDYVKRLKQCHEDLKKFRPSDSREFFNASCLEHALKVIKKGQSKYIKI